MIPRARATTTATVFRRSGFWKTRSKTAAALFPPQWINGADCSTETPIQVHQVDENTWILRQSMCTNFEGPFLYLLFGQDKALLEDTGAGNIQVQTQVKSIVDAWVAAHGKPATYPLVVVHTHGGQLVIEWQGEGTPVMMTGPAETVFSGVIEL